MAIDPVSTYLFLTPEGGALPVPGGEAFWSQGSDALAGRPEGWMVSEYVFERDWSHWEMHPEGDELVYVLEGEVTMLLELPSGLQAEQVQGRGMIRVPRGVWHTAQTASACRLLHLTMGRGTQSRPVKRPV